MKTIQVLGLTKDYICVISEVLSDAGVATNMDIYLNIKLDFVPTIATKDFEYSIMPFGELPDKEKPVIFGVCGPRNKSPVFESFFNSTGIKKELYANIFHPTAYISSSSVTYSGILLEPGVIISSQSVIDFGVTIKRGSLIGHHNVIGEYTDINPGVVLSGHVTIGRGCIIGSGTIVNNNITIGENTYIGAGSFVNKEIPSNCIAYGNPCKFIKANELWSI